MVEKLEQEEMVASAISCKGSLSSSLQISFFDVLVNTRGCGLFLVVDRLLQGTLPKISAVYELLDILRNAAHHSAKIRLLPERNLGEFVSRLLTASEDIVMQKNKDKSSPLYTAAKQLVDSVDQYKLHEQSPERLQQRWEEFLLVFYRENLYLRLCGRSKVMPM